MVLLFASFIRTVYRHAFYLRGSILTQGFRRDQLSHIFVENVFYILFSKVFQLFYRFTVLHNEKTAQDLVFFSTIPLFRKIVPLLYDVRVHVPENSMLKYDLWLSAK